MPYYRFEVVLKTSAEARPNGFWGAHLRSALGVSLRESCCPFPGAPCAECLLRFDCAYATAWHTFVHPENENAGIPPGVTTNNPHPFILRQAPDTPEVVAAGRLLRFGLVILGEHTRKTAFWVTALKRMAQRGLGKNRPPLKLMQVKRTGGRRSKVVYKSTQSAVSHPGEPEYLTLDGRRDEQESARPRNIKLVFRTPVRIRYRDEEPVEPTPKIIWDSLTRRLMGIMNANGAEPTNIPKGCSYEEMPAGKWKKVRLERWSSTQQRRIPASGYAGEAELTGVPEEHMSWWNAGELLGVGKMAAFGLGAYDIEEIG